MQKRRSTGSGPDHREKERYKGEKDVIHKKREERKLKQREGKWRKEKSEHSCYKRLNVYKRSYKKLARNK
jgi:hypothetical protein